MPNRPTILSFDDTGTERDLMHETRDFHGGEDSSRGLLCC